MTQHDQAMAVRRSISVDVPQERAFRVFTDGLDTWWPREHSIAENGMGVAVMEPREGGRWFERDAEGRECDWGRVLVWDPFARVVLAWQLSPQWQFVADPAQASEIEVRFIPETPSRTRVELEHRHIERHGAGAETMRDAVDSPGGWTLSLERYAGAVHAESPQGTR